MIVKFGKVTSYTVLQHLHVYCHTSENYALFYLGAMVLDYCCIIHGCCYKQKIAMY